MLFIRRIASLPSRILHIQRRTMSSFYVKSLESDDKLHISFDYSHNGGVLRTFNAIRPKTEEISKALVRLSANVSKKVIKRQKKKQETGCEEPNVAMQVLCSNGESVVPDEILAVDALMPGNIVKINHDTRLTVELNAPFCIGVIIPETIMVGFPLFPKLDLEFASLNDCTFLWEKIKYEETAQEEPSVSKKPRNSNNNAAKIIDTQEICNDYSYTPTNDDLGYNLKLTCFPKDGKRTGKCFSVESKFAVTAGPGVCPFETRHLYTKKPTGKGEFRVVSYNILADLYADQDFSREVLYPYCPAYALSLDYRKPLILTELKGYNSDIICLQEVDSKVFTGDLLPVLETLGFGGAFLPKGGQVVEGSAIFYRKTKFRYIDSHEVLLRAVLDNDAECEDIRTKAYTSEPLKEKLQSRTTILHILALEPIDRPGSILLVANTHLYFHPNAGHIRLIQNLTAVRYIEKMMKYYDRQKPCLVYCGDFNSTPHRGVYEFMTTQSVKETNIDWKDGGDEQFIPEMNFTHTLNVDSGCGKQAYTNYVSAFNGHLDYIYYDTDYLEVQQVIPQPDHKDVEFHTALPSIVFPSDHIAQVCDLKWKENGGSSRL